LFIALPLYVASGQPFLRADANFLRIAAKIGSRGSRVERRSTPVAEPHLEELAIWVRQLAEELAKQGYPVRQLLTQAGISERVLQGKDARIPFTKNASFFELAAEATNNSNLGLEFAQSRDTRDAGLLGYVGLNSPTVKDALKNLSRYRHVMSDALEINVDELENSGTIRWWRRGLAPARCRQYMEFGTTNLIRGLREVTRRRFRPVRVTFSHARNARIREFERFFGCPVEFGRRANLIELSQTDLSVPIIDADKRLLDVLRSYSTEVLAKHRQRPPSLIETVERLIVDRLSNAEARIDIVAKELAMSSRSLSRALAKLGTSFHAIVETLRKDLAHKYLKQGDFTLKEITFLLGYADISSFNHAFKRWTSKTPKQVRS
jgi:AraC-like DNA-binding protein